jgi:Uma2 family endonuclease
MAIERKLWTVEEYEAMVNKGVIEEDARVELIRGDILNMAPIGPRHAMCVRRLEKLFFELVGNSALVSGQSPIRLSGNSEPEPDIALLKYREDEYGQAHPTAGDVLLVIEVADSTLITDRMVKAPMYAEAGIPEMWIVNLNDNVIEVCATPLQGSYTQTRVVARGEKIGLPGGLTGSLSVSEILKW